MFDTVLVGVDGRSGGREAIALATLLSDPGAEIRLAHVFSAGRPLRRGSARALEAGYRAAEELLVGERERAGIRAIIDPVAASSVARGLSHRTGADVELITIGSCRRGPFGRIVAGDDTTAILQAASCPVAIAPRDYQAPAMLRRIGIGHDNSPEAIRGLELARALGRRHHASISALAVVSLESIPPGEPLPPHWPTVAGDLVEAEAQRVGTLPGVTGESVYGDPAEELARFGADLDLLIVGSRGLSALGRLMHGSASEYLARKAPCPVLVVPRGAELGSLDVPVDVHSLTLD